MEIKRFNRVNADNKGFTGIESFSNSSNMIDSETVRLIFDGDSGSIDLMSMLKEGSRNKASQDIDKDDLIEDFLPKNEDGVIDDDNRSLLLSLIKRESIVSMPKIIYEGREVSVKANEHRAQQIFFRIKGSTETINIREILKTESKNKKLEDIVLDDIKEAYRPVEADSTVTLVYDDIIKLFRGESLDSNPPLFYNGKYIELDTSLYVAEGVATDSVTGPGIETKNASANREYYLSTDTNGVSYYVETREVIPPVYKKLSGDGLGKFSSVEIVEKLKNGEQVAGLETISYIAEDGSKKYRRNQEIALVNGELYAVPKGWYADPSRPGVTEPDKHIEKRVKVGELQTKNVKATFSAKAVSENRNPPSYVLDINGRKCRLTVHSDRFFIATMGKNPQVREFITAGTTVPTNMSTRHDIYRIKGFTGRFNPDTGMYNMSMDIVDTFIKDAENSASASLDEQISSNLIADSTGKVSSIRSISNNPREIDFNNIFGGEFKLTQEDALKMDFTVYEKSPLFTKKLDAEGKKTEEDELTADIIQTTDVNENGEFEAYDMELNNQLVLQFLADIEELQEEISKLKTTGDTRDVDKIKELKARLDENLKTIEKIRNKNSITSINKVIQDYQKGEFFETFYFDEQGNMYEIKDGRKIELSANAATEYEHVMKDIIGNYNVVNQKGKCVVKFNDKTNKLLGGFLKATEIFFNLSLSGGIISSIIGVLGTAVVGIPCLGLAIGTAGFNFVRNKIKQYQLNHFTPEKLKKKIDKSIETDVKKEIKKATKEYEKALKRIKKNELGAEEVEKLNKKAEEEFKLKRAKLIAKLNLLNDTTINSKFSVKDKKITFANLFGRAEWAKQMKAVKKGAEPDFDLKQKQRIAKEQADKKLQEFKNGLDPNLSKKEQRAQLKAQKHAYKVAINDELNEYKKEHGPLKDRLRFLKQTKKYLLASDEDKKKMVKDFKEEIKKASQIKEVSSSTVSAGKDVEKKKQSLVKYINDKSPKKLEITEEEMDKLRSDVESRAHHVKDRELAKTATTEAEANYAPVAGVVKAIEHADEVVNESNASQELEKIGDALEGKYKEERDKRIAKEEKIEKKKQEGLEKKKAKAEKEAKELAERKEKAKAYNDMIMDSFLGEDADIKKIVEDGDLELYARVYNKVVAKSGEKDDIEKVQEMLAELSNLSPADRKAMLRTIKTSVQFKKVFSERLEETNKEIIKELISEHAEFKDTLKDKQQLTILAKICRDKLVKNNKKVADPKFSMKKKDGTVVPTYTSAEMINIFLEALKKANNKVMFMEHLKQSKEFVNAMNKLKGATA